MGQLSDSTGEGDDAYARFFPKSRAALRDAIASVDDQADAHEWPLRGFIRHCLSDECLAVITGDTGVIYYHTDTLIALQTELATIMEMLAAKQAQADGLFKSLKAMGGERDAAESKVATLTGLLRKLEWAGMSDHDEPFCLICDGNKYAPDQGHTDDCELADALKPQ